MQEIRLSRRSVGNYIWAMLAGVGWFFALVALAFYLGYCNG
jgi:hypothetical protein